LVRRHHERWDGGGYPTGRAGSAIPAEARLLAVVDAFDAMVSNRPYRRALSTAEALAELDRGAGSQFDPELAEGFVSAWREGTLKSAPAAVASNGGLIGGKRARRCLYDWAVNVVRLTVVADDLQAEVVCGLLRSNGIRCMHHKSGFGAAISAESGGVTIAGPTEILVDETDLQAARNLLEQD
jgi:hypothetical protein